MYFSGLFSDSGNNTLYKLTTTFTSTNRIEVDASAPTMFALFGLRLAYFFASTPRPYFTNFQPHEYLARNNESNHTGFSSGIHCLFYSHQIRSE
jgi:hypothetical protein